jgi:hypothetical protein
MSDADDVKYISRALRVLVVLTCSATIFLLGLLGFWYFGAPYPIETSPKPYVVVLPENKQVEQGGIVTYKFDYDKQTDVIPTVQRQFVDGLIFNVAGDSLPAVTSRGSGSAKVQVFVPLTLPPGRYHIKIITTYDMNPVRSFVIINTTETFEVIPRVED